MQEEQFYFLGGLPIWRGKNDKAKAAFDESKYDSQAKFPSVK